MATQDYASKHKELGLCRSCLKSVAKRSTIYCESHRDIYREHRRITEKKAAVRFKNECLEHYGKECNCCGEVNTKFLTLEHQEGNGNNHRRELFKHNVGGVHMYRWLKKNGFPKGYAVLCMNCNWATRYGGICPHKLER